jgi:hypothetical protein
MNSQPDGFEDLRDRVAELEQQNRRFKQLGAVVLTIAAVIVVMGQAPALKSGEVAFVKADTVETHELVLKDHSGVIRARLSIEGAMSQLALMNEKGKATAEVQGAALGGGTIVMMDGQGMPNAMLTGSTLRLGDVIGNVVGAGNVAGNLKSAAYLAADELHITDDKGFEAIVGTANLVTPRSGETHKTSAASIALVDKDKNVIWKAP